MLLISQWLDLGLTLDFGRISFIALYNTVNKSRLSLLGKFVCHHVWIDER